MGAGPAQTHMTHNYRFVKSERQFVRGYYKLTKYFADGIRRAYATGNWTMSELAEMYHVTTGAVSRIINMKSYR